MARRPLPLDPNILQVPTHKLKWLFSNLSYAFNSVLQWDYSVFPTQKLRPAKFSIFTNDVTILSDTKVESFDFLSKSLIFVQSMN